MPKWLYERREGRQRGEGRGRETNQRVNRRQAFFWRGEVGGGGGVEYCTSRGEEDKWE